MSFGSEHYNLQVTIYLVLHNFKIQNSILYKSCNILKQRKYSSEIFTDLKYLYPVNPAVLVEKTQSVVEELHFIQCDIFSEPP